VRCCEIHVAVAPIACEALVRQKRQPQAGEETRNGLAPAQEREADRVSALNPRVMARGGSELWAREREADRVSALNPRVMARGGSELWARERESGSGLSC
jgi:hypothetical protein